MSNSDQPFEHLRQKLQAVELLLLDVDGVLTDGSLLYHADGSETKVFHTKDGFGIKMLLRHGIDVGIVTGRSGQALDRRCRELGISLRHEGISDKAGVLTAICDETGLLPGQMAFMGDDLPDLPLMKRVGLAIAVKNAHSLVAESADMVTSAGGGQGAVREICDALLTAKGHMQQIKENYLKL